MQSSTGNEWKTELFLKFPSTETALHKQAQAVLLTSELAPAMYENFMALVGANPQLMHFRANEDVRQLLRVCAAIHTHFHLEVFDHVQVRSGNECGGTRLVYFSHVFLQIERHGICLLRITNTGRTAGYSVAIDVSDFQRHMVAHRPSFTRRIASAVVGWFG